MNTPASLHRDTHARKSFSDVDVGSTFECNGNLWTKRTKRTAVGIWPAYLPPFSYFRAAEQVHA